MLKRNVSVLSVEAFVKACASEKFKGPIGVNQFSAIPVDDLISFEDAIVSE